MDHYFITPHAISRDASFFTFVTFLDHFSKVEDVTFSPNHGMLPLFRQCFWVWFHLTYGNLWWGSMHHINVCVVSTLRSHLSINCPFMFLMVAIIWELLRQLQVAIHIDILDGLSHIMEIVVVHNYHSSFYERSQDGLVLERYVLMGWHKDRSVWVRSKCMTCQLVKVDH